MKKLTELDIETLNERWPLVSESLWRRLDLSLRAFTHAPTFHMLSGLKLASFLSEAELQACSLGSFNLGDLLSRWPVIFFDTSNLTPGLLERLCELFENLLGKDDPGVQNSEPDLEAPDLGNAERPIIDRMPRYTPSFEDELRLKRAMDALKNSNQFGSILEDRLGMYWPSNCGRAPFIEELNFKQLLELPLRHIVEQRSFTKSKLDALVLVLDQLAEVRPDLIKSTSPIRSNNYNIKCCFEDDRPIKEPLHSCSSYRKCMKTDEVFEVASWNYLFDDRRKCDVEMSEFLMSLSKALTPKQAIVFASADYSSSSNRAKKCCCTPFEIKKEDTEIKKLIFEIIQNNPTSFLKQLQTAIQLPACNLSEAVGSCSSKSDDSFFNLMIFTRIFFYLGAKELKYSKIKFTGYFSKNPKLFEVILAGVLEEAGESIKTRKRLLLEYFSEEVVEDILRLPL